MDLQTYLKDLKSNPKILKVLEHAYREEEKFFNGISPAAGILVKAHIEPDSGFWLIQMETELGQVVFSAENQDLSKVFIVSIPSKLRIQELRGLSLERGTLLTGSDDDLQKRMQVNYTVDLTNIADLQKCKKVFSKDYVLSAIKFQDTKRRAYELLPTFLRDYRKVFLTYQKKYSFLWQDLPYKSAIQVWEAISDLS